MQPPIQKSPKEEPTPWAVNIVRWTPSAKVCPMTHVTRGNPTAGAAAITVGLAFGILSALGMGGGAWWSGVSLGTTLLLTPFLFTSLLILGWGLSQFIARRVVVIREEEVEVDSTGMLSRQHWQERIRRYAGVLKRLRYYGDTGKRPSDTYYEIWLKHKDPARDILLFRSSTWRRVDTAWREFAKRFRIPALEETPEGITQVSSHFGVDQFVKARTRNKEVAWWEPNATDFSPRLTFQREGTNFRMVHALSWGRWKDVQGLMASAFIAAGVPFLLPQALRAPVILIGAGFACLFTARLIYKRVAKEELLISYAGIEHSMTTPWGTRLVKQLPSELIQNVVIEKSRGPFPSTVVSVRSGKDAVRFGAHLTEDDKEKLHDFVILVLSHGPGALQAAS